MRVLELYISVAIESFFMVSVGLSVVNIRPKISKLAYLSIICGLTVFAVRLLYETYPIPLGTHSFILTILFTIILKYIGKQKWSTAFIAVLISFLLLTLGEGMIMYNVAKWANISSSDLLYKPGARFLGIMLSNSLLITVFIISYIFKFSIIDLNRFTENKEF